MERSLASMEPGIAFTHLDLDVGERFVSLRTALGLSTFGLNLILLEPRQRGRIHRHERQEEVYVVLEGELTLIVEGEEHTLRPGDAVRVAPELRRQLVNRGGERLAILAMGGAEAHVGRDGIAFEGWDAVDGRPPQEIPLPDDLPG
jgi:uncharacterized cupin superfamily protein